MFIQKKVQIYLFDKILTYAFLVNNIFALINLYFLSIN
jgi:hypothetical protein